MNSAAEDFKKIAFSKNDTKMVLEEYHNVIKFNTLNRVIDIGSGDGGGNSVLKTFLPQTTQVLGVDISEKMLTYANEHHGDERTKFILLDITSKMPEALVGTFDLVFSSYLLHWVYEQEAAIKNMYDLLSPGGQCFAIYFASHLSMDVIYEMARRPRFQPYANWAGFMFNHKDSTATEKVEKAKIMMTEGGFTNVTVRTKDLSFDHGPLASWRAIFAGVNPFNFPAGLEDEYYDECLKMLREMMLQPEDDVDEKHFISDYKLIIAHGVK